jgi:hypothetical protein
MKICQLLAFLLFALTVNAQYPDLPIKIKSPFYKKFPTAIDLNWAENKGKYEIEFYMGPDLYTAVYDESGNWLETAVILSDDQIPENLLAEIAKKHPDAGLAYAEKVWTSNSEEFIRVVTESENMVYTVNARSDGTIIKIDIQNYNSSSEDFDDNEGVE